MRPEAGGLASLPEYANYLRAREAVLRMKGATATGTQEPSAYWTDELENIDYLVEASPLIVRKLRHHAFHITGIRPYDYRVKNDSRRQHFEARLHALRAIGGDDLLVGESPALGGFGYEIDGRMLNVDTLKFYEVLVGMRRGGVLEALSSAGKDRPIVCEIGPGWGGFAYQFKTLFPKTTYVLVDFAELFLFSATYLATVFPGARLHFAADDSLTGWQDADFVFVPHTSAAIVSQLPLDLTVNMVSFQEMTDAQVRGYAAMAADAGCPLLYSLNRERSPYNTEIVSVSDALSDRYRLTDVEVLPTDYTSAMKKPPRPEKPVERPANRRQADSELNYRHQVGRLAAVARKPAAGAGVRAVLGMTLYNNAGNVREALDSLLAQTYPHFTLILLNDASTDGTAAICQEYAQRDSRVRYFAHAQRQAMIATWHEAAEIALREAPSAEFFAWVSDHDRWHPRWLERMIAELDADAGAVLAYPITRRTEQTGEDIDKGPRLFDTAGCATLEERWRHFCHEGVGAGDMVYGLMRIPALVAAGIFRRVLRPDRLLVAEMTLRGRIRQVPEVLWFRRQSQASSIDRQHKTLVLEGTEPRWFGTPPWLQHTLALWREYVAPTPRPLPLATRTWVGMLLRYQLTYGRRHFRKTRTSHAIGRGIENGIFGWKLAKHYWRHAVYNALVGARAASGRGRRLGRRALYHVLVLTHRLGLRGRGETSTR
jgi:putative sugar O-methyltransferase